MTLLTIAGTKPLIPKSMMVLFVATKRDLARDKLNLCLCHGTQDVKLKRDWITNGANLSGSHWDSAGSAPPRFSRAKLLGALTRRLQDNSFQIIAVHGVFEGANQLNN